eukprot:scaffold252962_cov33-Tisochrysis_lutea.AAC.2
METSNTLVCGNQLQIPVSPECGVWPCIRGHPATSSGEGDFKECAGKSESQSVEVVDIFSSDKQCFAQGVFAMTHHWPHMQ